MVYRKSRRASDRVVAEIFSNADVWMNVGFFHTEEDAGEKTFVGLPYSFPIDTLSLAASQSSKLYQAQNMLLSELQAIGARMAPGQQYFISQLTVQLVRHGQPEADAHMRNPYIATLRELGITPT